MPANNFNIETLWREEKFNPTQNQEDAIRHLDGPLYRQFVAGSRARKEAAFKQHLEDYGTELEQQEWLSSEIEIRSTNAV